MVSKISATEKQVTEISLFSVKNYNNPFNDIELNVTFEDLEGALFNVPAFWNGKSEWKVRFAPPGAGEYKVKTICSDENNIDLHQKEYLLTASGYTGNNKLLKSGSLKIAGTGRTLEYEDGTPFFWLADTWWMGLCNRLTWPEDFQTLTKDRVQKGFNVIMIVAGLYPDMPDFDPRGMNEAGFPWENDYTTINPSYFEFADMRIGWLVKSGLIPCIVGSWGYYLPKLGMKKMKQFWRYLIARYASSPVVWCIAGEASMPFYLSKTKDEDKKLQMEGFTEIGKFIRETDPYKRIITIHPTEIGRDQVIDDSIIDIDLLQTGHSGYSSVCNSVLKVNAEYERKPRKPVIIGEVNYDGIIHGTDADNQRLNFWSSVLSGCAGYTYGANGIWQINTKEKPYGASPHGGNWGNTPWEEAYKKPGSLHLGLAKKLLERYEWWKFEPRQDWVEPCGTPENPGLPFAAGIPEKIRIIYFYEPVFPWAEIKPKVKGFEPGIRYKGFFWNPTTGEEHPIGEILPDQENKWEIPVPPVFHDWALVMENFE